MPMPASISALQSALLNRAWNQWIALGVDALGERDETVVDPEALIALTAELGDADARLRDVSTDWCVAYGRYINGSRLKQVARELATPSESIGEYVATVAAAGGPTWPMATQPRAEYVTRGKARLDAAVAPALLRIRLRAAFGVNARADILAALLGSPAGLGLANLARITRFTKPSVAFAADALVLAGLLEERSIGNERRMTLGFGGKVLPGLRPPIVQPDWIARFAVALSVVRFKGGWDGPTSVRAIEARRLVEDLRPRIDAGGLPQPNMDVSGDEFATAFERWTVRVVEFLRSPG
jgi:hypothetical protein